MTSLPHGCQIFSSMPDILFIPEFVFGGLVWTLVASTEVSPSNPLGWVMFVSLFCFVMTTIWLFIFVCGKNQSVIWPGIDLGYHAIATLIYLSAAVHLAYVTIILKPSLLLPGLFKVYQLDVAAVVMAFLATLTYFIHAIFSAHRWKAFQ